MLSSWPENKKILLLISIVTFTASGCATNTFRVTHIDSEKWDEAKRDAILSAAAEVPEDVASLVPVLEVHPTWAKDGQTLNWNSMVAGQIAGRHLDEKISIETENVKWLEVEPFGDGFGWRFYPYETGESWRKGWCYWQVPLNWVTLSVWYFVSPLYWTCHVKDTPKDAQKLREGRMVLLAQKIAIAMKADAVMIHYFNFRHMVPTKYGSTEEKIMSVKAKIAILPLSAVKSKRTGKPVNIKS